MPSEDTGPDSEVMKPTLRSAASAFSARPAPITVAAMRCMAFIRVLLESKGKAADAGATADVQHLAGDEAGIGMDEERHRTRHVGGLAHAANGDRSGEL